jgi:hypothetical protein
MQSRIAKQLVRGIRWGQSQLGKGKMEKFGVKKIVIRSETFAIEELNTRQDKGYHKEKIYIKIGDKP